MNATNSRYRVVMLKNNNSMMKEARNYLESDLELIKTKNKIIVDENTIIYYLLDPKNKIIGIISLLKMFFTDFQNAANNDKVYAFGIQIENEELSHLFISQVWNDFINNKGNFIFCFDLTYIKGLIEELNNLYNIYYKLNLENISLIFGPKVVGKKKYLKIQDGKDNKLNKINKSNNQKSHINAYLRNYPNNNPSKKTQNLSQNNNGSAMPTTTFSNNNERKPLLDTTKTKPSSFFGFFKKIFK